MTDQALGPKRPWSVPLMWSGRTVAILASGPSMSQAVADAVRAAGVPAIAINTTHRLAPWADLLYACDPEWWQHPTNADAHRFRGVKVCLGGVVAGVHRLHIAGTLGVSTQPGCICTGGNSGYQALQVALHGGARRVLLCGFDMTAARGGHWHGGHPAGLKNTMEETFVVWRRRFEAAAPFLAAAGLEVINCTPRSALTCFPKGTLESELARAVPAA